MKPTLEISSHMSELARRSNQQQAERRALAAAASQLAEDARRVRGLPADLPDLEVLRLLRSEVAG